MPKRPRSHVLEDESRQALRNALPSLWVVRDVTPDYGIDIEVEIFGPDGEATAQRFLVQLKATDNTNLSQALRLRFRHATAKYYTQCQQPVLVLFSLTQIEMFFIFYQMAQFSNIAVHSRYISAL